MWRLIKNPSGVIVEVSDQMYCRLIKQRGFSEVQTYEKDWHEKQREPTQDDMRIIPFVSIRSEAEGYTESRDGLVQFIKNNKIALTDFREAQGDVWLAYTPPNNVEMMKGKVNLLYSMTESSKIPKEWQFMAKQATEVFVPSQSSQRAFARGGVKSTVVPLGYNHLVYVPQKRETDRPFTFLHYDAFNTRKGWDVLFKAFTEEFKHDEAKLILKSRNKPPIPIIESEYPNIEVQVGVYNHGQMMDLLKQADAFVYPSVGEGFGLPPLEAMATGIPALIPNATGMATYFNDSCCFEVPTSGYQPAIYRKTWVHEAGTMHKISVKGLKKIMRYMVNNQKEVKEKGKIAQEYAKKWTIQKSANKLAKEINKYEGSSRLAPVTIRKSDNSDVTVVVPHMKKRAQFFERYVRPSIEVNKPAEILVYDGNEHVNDKRNRALREAKTKYVFYCDDDMVMAKDCLRQLRYALEDAKAYFAYSDHYVINHPQKPYQEKQTAEWGKHVLKNPFVPAQMLVLREEFAEWDNKLEGLHDWDVTIQMHKLGKPGVRVPQLLYMQYYLRDDSITDKLMNGRWDHAYQVIKKKHGL